MKKGLTYTNVDEYIQQFDVDVSKKLSTMRAIVRKCAKDAEESIAYQMPAYKLNGPLVYFAALKNHIGFYPTPSGVTAFLNETKLYQSTKGAIQFPYDKPLPVELIARIVKFRVKENLAKQKLVPARSGKRKST